MIRLAVAHKVSEFYNNIILYIHNNFEATVYNMRTVMMQLANLITLI